LAQQVVGLRLAKSVAKSATADAGGHQGAYKFVVLVPCYNEEVAIAKVVKDFRAALPGAAIFVFDNNPTDKTAAIARAAGAEVFREKHQGKGFVVQRMSFTYWWTATPPMTHRAPTA
jgi:cellulose synthase/poly-beta-1,6-N-acetylglucosamine synthase-like glycosyltransferase